VYYLVRHHSARDMPYMNSSVGLHRHASSFVSIWPAAVMNDKPHLIVNRQNVINNIFFSVRRSKVFSYTTPARSTSYIVSKVLSNLNLIYVVLQVTQRCKESKETISTSLKRHSENKCVLNTTIPTIFQFEKSSYRQETNCKNEHTSNNSC
jgi:hypothetical protein